MEEHAHQDQLPSVAACIPTFNQAKFLRPAVDSVLDQSYEGPLEIWIGDDASTDDTPAVLDALVRTHNTLRVKHRSENVGIALNTSDLMRSPRTEFIIRLDSDDVLEPDFIARLVPLMRANAAAGYGHTAVTEIDEHGSVTRLRRLARATGNQGGEAALRASLAGYRTAANVLIFRRSALEALNFMDGRPEFVEDYDLSIRMADAGYENVYVDEPLARYRVWTDAGGIRARRKGLQLEGYIRIFDETLTPAWQRRNWDVESIGRRRKRLAAHNCASCFARQYTDAERAHLIALLRELGDGRQLTLYMFLCRLGLASWIDRLSHLRRRLKDPVKWALRSIRAIRRPQAAG